MLETLSLGIVSGVVSMPKPLLLDRPSGTFARVLVPQDLHTSLSAPSMETLEKGPVPWAANVFLIYAFKWIAARVDVDGDGRFTVMDSFKYASSLANDGNLGMKTFLTDRIFDLREAWQAAKTARQADPA